MGVSTDGILCFGFRLKDEEGQELEDNLPSWLRADPDGKERSFENFLANLVGLSEPDGNYDQARYRSDAEYAKSWNDYWHEKVGLEKELGVTLVVHCKDDYQMYILAAEESVTVASRGCPEELGQQIVASPEWREKLCAFCERAGIPFEEPQFLLCSYWS